MIRKFLAPVTAHTQLTAPGHHVLEFHAPELAHDAAPGQFVAVAPEAGPQILRRPFSVYTADPERGTASILFSVYGATTRALALKRPGDTLDLIGPLGGKGFQADPDPATHHIMVGGGYGVPPLAFLTRRIFAANPEARISFIVGARTANLLVGTDGLSELRAVVLPCTEDGSTGYAGRVTGQLTALLDESTGPFHLYSCGPTPMMKAVADVAADRSLPCQVSLEPFMPCGIGICMGCAVALPDGTFARGCTEGPVFRAEEVLW
ncbi:MAG: dihydroorotate dehydrogenase electron transfer subunit [Armatimonadaceae bacterium]